MAQPWRMGRSATILLRLCVIASAMAMLLAIGHVHASPAGRSEAVSRH